MYTLCMDGECVWVGGRVGGTVGTLNVSLLFVIRSRCYVVGRCVLSAPGYKSVNDNTYLNRDTNTIMN